MSPELFGSLMIALFVVITIAEGTLLEGTNRGGALWYGQTKCI